MSQESENKARGEALEKASQILGEHFECGQILLTFQEGVDTYRVYKGFGNWYARQGMAMEFLHDDEARAIANEISKKIDFQSEDDDGNDEKV